MNNYLSEAFKKLDILDEDVFELDKDGLTALKDFEDSDEDDMITVVDPDAESEEDLEDSYIGKVILDCSVCHTDIYKDKEDITIDEESGLANIGEECPYCYSSDGFKVIGEVKPFVEVEVDTDDDVDVEVDGEEVEKNESFRRNRRLKESSSINQCQKWVDYDMKKYKKISDDTMKKIKSSGYSVVKDQYGDYEVIADRKDESLKNRKPRKMKESIEDNEQDIIDIGRAILDDKRKGITSSGNWWELKLKGNYGSYDLDEIADDVTGGSFSGKTDSGIMWKLKIDNKLKESIEDITIDTGDQEISVSAKDKEEVKSDDEMIAPLSDEVKADIEMGPKDNTVDVDVDDFSEEDFDELGESYLKKVYENVDSYRTVSAKTKGNKLYLEGLIKFNSGKEKKTSFVFESRTITKTGKAKLIGENLQISRGHKSFKLTGTINNGKFISESLNYNYRVKNGNSSQRVYGTAKKSK